MSAGQPGEGKQDADSSLCLPIVTSLVLLRKPDLAAAVPRADKDAASKEQLAAPWDSAFSWLLSRVTGLYAMQKGWLSSFLQTVHMLSFLRQPE